MIRDKSRGSKGLSYNPWASQKVVNDNSGIEDGQYNTPIALKHLHLLIYRNGHPQRQKRVLEAMTFDVLEEFSRRLGIAMNARVSDFRHEVTNGTYYFCGDENCDRQHLILSTDLPPASLRKLPASLFILHKPTWPIHSILLPVRGMQEDDMSLAWAILMAHIWNARITVLVITPPVPEMYSGLARMHIKIKDILESDTKTGSALRKIAQHLYRESIPAELVVRQGYAEIELCREKFECGQDLVVLPGTHHSRVARWLWGDLEGILAKKLQKSILISSSIARKNQS